MKTESIEKDTARTEAFSDGIFGVAITLLVIELKAPVLETINNKNLFYAMVEKWPEYLTILNSFASILVMWIGHHSLFKQVKKATTPFMAVNGLLLLFVTLTVFSTKVLSAYLMTDAAKIAAAFYAFTSVLLCGAFYLLWYQVIKDRSLLVHSLSDETISKQSKSYGTGLVIYIIATAMAFVNPWITICIITASWVFWIANYKKIS